jgi:hypothetical protein
MTRPYAESTSRGLLLLEMLLALAITAMLGVAVAGVIIMAGQGASTQNDMQESFVRLGLLGSRINASIRESSMVLARGDEYLLLWVADTRADGLPNLSELRLIERDADTRQIGQSIVELPTGLSPGQLALLDTAYPLTTDFGALVAQLKSDGRFVYTLWGRGLEEWALELDDPLPHQATVVSHRLRLTVGTVEESAVSSARLRNQ